MAQPYFNRVGNDEQYTPRYGVRILLPHIQHLKDRIIWCPFDTSQSNFVKVLTENGFQVEYSHIWEGKDYFEYEPEKWDVMISNPPYKNKRSYLERALSFNKPFALLLPLTSLNDTIFHTVFRGKEDKFQMLIPDRRMQFINSTTKREGPSPTFKAVYFAYDLFKQQLIFQDFKLGEEELWK